MVQYLISVDYQINFCYIDLLYHSTGLGLTEAQVLLMCDPALHGFFLQYSLILSSNTPTSHSLLPIKTVEIRKRCHNGEQLELYRSCDWIVQSQRYLRVHRRQGTLFSFCVFNSSSNGIPLRGASAVRCPGRK